MRAPYSNRQILTFSSEAFDEIEKASDSVIWRTNSRIFELVQKNNPGSENPYYRSPLWFTDILIRRLFNGGMTPALGKMLVRDSEKFEEASDEPILLEDLKASGDEIYAAIFTERMFYMFLHKGMSINEAIGEFRRVCECQLDELEVRARFKGIFEGSIFYRRVDTPRGKLAKSPPPAVPIVMN